MSAAPALPEPACRMGYTDEQVDEILGPRRDEFTRYMARRTWTVCDGRTWDHDRRKLVPSGCGPHDAVVYTRELVDFLTAHPEVYAPPRPTHAVRGPLRIILPMARRRAASPDTPRGRGQ